MTARVPPLEPQEEMQRLRKRVHRLEFALEKIENFDGDALCGRIAREALETND